MGSMRFAVRKTSTKYPFGPRDSREHVELESLDHLMRFIRDAGQPCIIWHAGQESESENTIEIYDDFRE